MVRLIAPASLAYYAFWVSVSSSVAVSKFNNIDLLAVQLHLAVWQYEEYLLINFASTGKYVTLKFIVLAFDTFLLRGYDVFLAIYFGRMHLHRHSLLRYGNCGRF